MQESSDFNLPSDIFHAIDEKISKIKKDEKELPFSSEIILRDLVKSGVAVLDALDCLYAIKDVVKPGIDTERITHYINNALKERGYSDNAFIKGKGVTQPIYVNNEILSYKYVKQYVKKQLYEYTYTSKTFRAIVDELFRIIKSLRADKVNAETMKNMLPNACVNVLGINPFEKNNRADDYLNYLRLTEYTEKTWPILPDDEKPVLLQNLFNSAYRVVLLTFNYLPFTFKSSLHQIGRLAAEQSQNKSQILTEREIYVLGQTTRKLQDLRAHTKQNSPQLENYLKIQFWSEELEGMNTLVEGLMTKGSIYWMIIADSFGNEVYSKFSPKYQQQTNKNLLSMAMSGVQTLMREITNGAVTQIEQGLNESDKTSIIIEKRDYFSIIMLVQQPVRHLFRQLISNIAGYVEQELSDEIKKFKGSVGIFHKILDGYVSSQINEYM